MHARPFDNLERTWVREEGVGLLRSAHETMARVLLAQFAVLGAAIIRGIDATGFLLAVPAICLLSVLGAYYSFEQLRHSRFLHLYLLEGGTGSPFVRDLQRLRELAKEAQRSVKRRAWEERVCLAGYATAPLTLLLALIAAPVATLGPRIFCPIIVSTMILIFLLGWWYTMVAFRQDKETWQWYFLKEGKPSEHA